MISWRRRISERACPCLLPTTVPRHVAVLGHNLEHNSKEMWCCHMKERMLNRILKIEILSSELGKVNWAIIVIIEDLHERISLSVHQSSCRSTLIQLLKNTGQREEGNNGHQLVSLLRSGVASHRLPPQRLASRWPSRVSAAKRQLSTLRVGLTAAVPKPPAMMTEASLVKPAQDPTTDMQAPTRNVHHQTSAGQNPRTAGQAAAGWQRYHPQAVRRLGEIAPSAPDATSAGGASWSAPVSSQSADHVCPAYTSCTSRQSHTHTQRVTLNGLSGCSIPAQAS